MGALPSIFDLKPEKYIGLQDLREPNLQAAVFQIEDESDFNWLEKKILDNGFYESQIAWTLKFDDDKRLMSGLLSSFTDKQYLELGCGNGGTMQGLFSLGKKGIGLDISSFNIKNAFPNIRTSIIKEDLLTFKTDKRFDLIFGLDIFEHFNPNKLHMYIEKISTLLEEGGLCFANIPAYGFDRNFGTIFPIHFLSWHKDVTDGKCFQTIHCDEKGYPINGHLINAHSSWWEKQFLKEGLTRLDDIELAIHKEYDDIYDSISVARKCFYVFGKNVPKDKVCRVISKIHSSFKKIRKIKIKRKVMEKMRILASYVKRLLRTEHLP